MVNYLYFILCCVRILLVLSPQTGYIHPDEHFQGPEVVYGDILELKVHKTWEFTSQNPIRNIVYPYLVAGFPSLITDLLKANLWGTLSYPYLLLMLPRLIMCCLSFIQDILLFKCCRLMKKNYEPCLTVFASSYVTLVYLTRTFSNSLESLFFSFMIYLTCKLLHLKESPNIPATVPCTYICYMLGLVLGMGVYNRPTFLCFAVFPMTAVLNVLYRMKASGGSYLSYFNSFQLGALSIVLSFTAIDTLYYNEAHFTSWYDLHETKPIVTPFNFILYNADVRNLDDHGVHSRWMHLCVNVPLLFSVYGVLTVIKFFRSICSLFKSPHLGFQNVLLLSLATPLFLLSFIPHQEPRFILPLIFPLALAVDDSFCSAYVGKKTLRKLWYAQNVLAVFFYGFCHQGGIYTSASHIHSVIHKDTKSAIIYYKTYMPPRYLLGLELARKNVQVYDFAGIDLGTLDSYVVKMKMLSKPKVLYVVVPHEIVNPILNLTSVMLDYKFFKRKYIFPHLSTESLPDLNKMLVAVRSNSSVVNKLLEIKKAFSIHVLTFKSIL